MARRFAIVFGAVYVLVGVLGFILPSPLLGTFGVNTRHDIVHLLIGGAWLAAAIAAPRGLTPRIASQVIGVGFLILAIAGFAFPTQMDQLLVINLADNFLHLGTGILALYVGFMAPRGAMAT